MYRFDTLAFLIRGFHKVPRLCGENEEQQNERVFTVRWKQRYGACDDVQGLGKATPQQDSAQDKIEHNASRFCCCATALDKNNRLGCRTDKTPRAYAKFGPAAESCSIQSTLLSSSFSFTLHASKESKIPKTRAFLHIARTTNSKSYAAKPKYLQSPFP